MMPQSQPFYLFLFLSNQLAATVEVVAAVLAFMDFGVALLALADTALRAVQCLLPILVH
jgi:hypothetical protein